MARGEPAPGKVWVFRPESGDPVEKRFIVVEARVLPEDPGLVNFDLLTDSRLLMTNILRRPENLDVDFVEPFDYELALLAEYRLAPHLFR